MKTKKSILRSVIKSPAFSIVLAGLLIFCGLLEAFETVFDQLEVIPKAHHGIIIFGIGQILKSLVDVMEGTEGMMVTEVAENIEKEVEELEVS